MWKVLTLFKFNPAGLPRDRRVNTLSLCWWLMKELEETIPLYEPDLSLLFGMEKNGGAKRSSPLSESWAALLPHDDRLPGEDERMTFSISSQ